MLISQRLHDKSIRIIYFTLHIVMLVLSLFLIVSISIDSFRDLRYYDQPQFVRLQTWICVVFLLDFFVELALSKRKLHYIATHFVFLLISIPYLFIIYKMKWHFSANVTYLLQYIPLVRGGYALAFVVGWFTYNRATGIFITYIVTLMATVYFGSLVFYTFERSINPGITCYSDALWWACMDTTTVGSSIDSITPVGRVIAVILAALGMMMFPIFTVYVTSLISRRRKEHPTLLNSKALNTINHKLNIHSPQQQNDVVTSPGTVETDAGRSTESGNGGS